MKVGVVVAVDEEAEEEEEEEEVVVVVGVVVVVVVVVAVGRGVGCVVEVWRSEMGCGGVEWVSWVVGRWGGVEVRLGNAWWCGAVVWGGTEWDDLARDSHLRRTRHVPLCVDRRRPPILVVRRVQPAPIVPVPLPRLRAIPDGGRQRSEVGRVSGEQALMRWDVM